MENEIKDKGQGRLAKYLLVTYAMRKVSYFIRGFAGGYLVYLMYQLFSESAKSGEKLSVWMIAVGVFMSVAGVYFVVGALYALVNGIYEENNVKEDVAEESVEENTEE